MNQNYPKSKLTKILFSHTKTGFNRSSTSEFFEKFNKHKGNGFACKKYRVMIAVKILLTCLLYVYLAIRGNRISKARAFFISSPHILNTDLSVQSTLPIIHDPVGGNFELKSENEQNEVRRYLLPSDYINFKVVDIKGENVLLKRI